MKPRLFSIAAGAPFLATLSRALLEGALFPELPAPGGVFALADATIYLPTQRAAREFSRELVRQSGGRALILPRIAPLGAFEPNEERRAFEEFKEFAPGPKPAVRELTRRLCLARLTRAWASNLRGAMRSIDASGKVHFDESEPALVGASPAQAFHLAGDLAALIDDMIIEGVAWERLNTVSSENYDIYWRITLDFLQIAMAHWPHWLEENGLIDRAARAAQLIDHEIEALAGPQKGPTIIAGSTGTNRATARLIGAIARSSHGAVVLPDLDLDLDARAWEMIAGGDDGMQGLAGHPQAALARLLHFNRIDRADVRRLGAEAPEPAARAKFLSQAMLPAEATEFWFNKRDALSDAQIAAGLARVALIEAEDEVDEALALAIAMRGALETPDRRAALITPDAGLAQRVCGELKRWGLDVDDSAGRSLGQTRAGAVARLILAAALSGEAPELAALLAHPLCQLGRDRLATEASARALRLGLFHNDVALGRLDSANNAIDAARIRAQDPHAHKTRRDLSDADWLGAQALLTELLAALAPLRGLAPASALSKIAQAHRVAYAAIIAGAASPGDDGDALEDFFDEWQSAAPEKFDCSLNDYAALFESALAGQRAPAQSGAHPRLAALGLLEARLLDFDLTLLAGLDEALWPPAAQTDAFLNRPMRAALGLSSPERRIGQTAHDFVAGMGAGDVIISRAKKRGDSPTTPSRFLQRMNAVAGEAAFAAMRARGDVWLDLARRLDDGPAVEPLTRPLPRPTPALRPARFSLTRVETLARDPYAIYAEAILKLAPLPPLGGASDARQIGSLWHACLKEFSEKFPTEGLPPDIDKILRDLAEAQFADLLADPIFRVLRWPGILNGFTYFLACERELRAVAARSFVEAPGKLEIALSTGAVIHISGRADRIDFLKDGGAAIIDYKTGAPPTLKQVNAGFAPQLPLEAAMLARGGFAAIPARAATRALYLKLGGADGGKKIVLETKTQTVDQLANIQLERTRELLNYFALESAPYIARPFPQLARSEGDYDHLSRFREWSATAGASDADGGDEA